MLIDFYGVLRIMNGRVSKVERWWYVQVLNRLDRHEGAKTVHANRLMRSRAACRLGAVASRRNGRNERPWCANIGDGTRRNMGVANNVAWSKMNV
jgi:hypothetical protein